MDVMSEFAQVYIGLGSNLGDRLHWMRFATEQLRALAVDQTVAVSSLYASAPMGPQDQPDYLNAVALLTTSLAPLALLDALQQIEHEAGRVRVRHWGERTLDLDLLYYADLTMSTPRLTLPHPGVGQRVFVDIPLQELKQSPAEIESSTSDLLYRVAGPAWVVAD